MFLPRREECIMWPEDFTFHLPDVNRAAVPAVRPTGDDRPPPLAGLRCRNDNISLHYLFLSPYLCFRFTCNVHDPSLIRSFARANCSPANYYLCAFLMMGNRGI